MKKAVLAWALAGAAVCAQPAMVIDTGAFMPLVANTNRSLAFYRDVLDMEVRGQSVHVRGSRTAIEPVTMPLAEHGTPPPRIEDPGNATLVLLVRDVDGTLARIRKARYPVVTAGGAPVALDDGTRAVIVRDVDDRFIELRQPPSIPASAPAHNVVDIGIMLTVADLTRSTRMYRDSLGFVVEGERTAFLADRPTQRLSGLPNARARWGRVRARDSLLSIELIEFAGVPRTAAARGAARLQVVPEGGTARPIVLE